MANLDKLPSGSYRYRKQIGGQKVNLIFDHKPTEREITLGVTKYLNEVGEKVKKSSFRKCCENYISLKKPVTSPSTVKGYNSIIRAMSEELLNTDINDITQVMVQNEISKHALSHAAKSTYNFHGFISSVLKMYRPNFILHTTLPQKIKYDNYVPSEEEVKAILLESENTPYHIVIQLGILGLRRSEACALDESDLSGNILSITKAKVESNNGYIIKPLTKTTAGKRTIYIPNSLVEEIKENGFFPYQPDAIVNYLHKVQRKLGIPNFRFHDLRGFYASYAHSQGIPDAVILESGGWKSDYVMKNVYRRAMEKDKQEYQKMIVDKILID